MRRRATAALRISIAFGGYLALRRSLSRDELAALVTWGGWLVVTGLVFTFMSGTIHPYYTVALAPAVGALVGLGGVWAWRCMPARTGRIALAAMMALGGYWSAILLHRSHFGPASGPWLVAGMTMLAAAVLVVGWRRATGAGLVVGTLGAVGSSALYTVATAATPHQGAVPIAVSSLRGASVHTVEREALAMRMAVGGWTGDVATNHELAELLAATHTPWSAATDGSQTAAVLELASGTSVMAIGGWSDDPCPTLKQFTDDVTAGKVTYYVDPAEPGTRGRADESAHHTASASREVTAWVAAHYVPVPVGKSLVYRLN